MKEMSRVKLTCGDVVKYTYLRDTYISVYIRKNLFFDLYMTNYCVGLHRGPGIVYTHETSPNWIDGIQNKTITTHLDIPNDITLESLEESREVLVKSVIGLAPEEFI